MVLQINTTQDAQQAQDLPDATARKSLAQEFNLQNENAAPTPKPAQDNIRPPAQDNAPLSESERTGRSKSELAAEKNAFNASMKGEDSTEIGVMARNNASTARLNIAEKKKQEHEATQRLLRAIKTSQDMQALLDEIDAIKERMRALEERMEFLNDRIGQAEDALESKNPQEIEQALNELYDVNTEGMSPEEQAILLQQLIDNDQQEFGEAEATYDDLYQEYINLVEQAQNAEPALLEEYADDLKRIEADINNLGESEKTAHITRAAVMEELSEKYETLDILEHVKDKQSQREPSFAEKLSGGAFAHAGNISETFQKAASGEETPQQNDIAPTTPAMDTSLPFEAFSP